MNNWLVVDLPLWKIWVNWDDDIPNIWKNKKCFKPPTSPWGIWNLQPIQGLQIFNRFHLEQVIIFRIQNQDDWLCASVPICEHCIRMVSWSPRTNQPQKQTRKQSCAAARMKVEAATHGNQRDCLTDLGFSYQEMESKAASTPGSVWLKMFNSEEKM